MATGSKLNLAKTQEPEKMTQSSVEKESKTRTKKRIPKKSKDSLYGSPNLPQPILPIETVNETLTLSQLMPSSQQPIKPISNILCIPAYNDEKEIGPIIIKSRPYVDRILVCDDGSDDLTGQIAEGLGATVIRHETRLGRAATLRTLLEHALELDPILALIMDVNPLYEASEIPKLISPLNLKEADVVVGGQQNRNADQLPSDNEDDLKSIFMAFSRKAIKAFISAPPGVLESQSRIVEVASSNAIYIKEVPIETQKESTNEIDSETPKKEEPEYTSIVQPQTNYEAPLKSGVGVFQRIIQVLINKSLLFFGLPGLVLLAAGILAGGYMVSTFLDLNYLSYPAAFVMLTGVISGLFLCTTSIVLKAFSNLVNNT